MADPARRWGIPDGEGSVLRMDPPLDAVGAGAWRVERPGIPVAGRRVQRDAAPLVGEVVRVVGGPDRRLLGRVAQILSGCLVVTFGVVARPVSRVCSYPLAAGEGFTGGARRLWHV